MYFSRRNVAAPSPPLPACTSILASSMNFMVRKQKSPTADDRALFWSGDRLRRNHADSVVGRGAAHSILHLARDAGVERVVPPHADVRSRMHFGAALAHEDLAGVDALAAIDLHAQTLGLRIASVPGAAACFLVCHSELTLDDVVDVDLGIRLPMSLGFLVVLAPAQLEDAHLVAAAMADDRRFDERARDERRADLDAVARAHEEHLVERNI